MQPIMRRMQPRMASLREDSGVNPWPPAMVLLVVVVVLLVRDGASKTQRIRIVMALVLAATIAGCDFALGCEPDRFQAPTPEHVISVEVDPDEARVGDVIYTMPRNPDGSCPTFAVAVKVAGSDGAGSRTGSKRQDKRQRRNCELVIDEIQRR